ncbi:MAG: ASKHA domain-containing protein [Oscillospiraceae bacterium]|jgi:uncharacterized 2Fe-2S/4Fe-4S cluster protein (DUF4445 family)|nr:ASKHA domain-containing protein [Oscillospiraceae bacterium]
MAQQFTVTFTPENGAAVEITTAGGEKLLDLARRASVAIDAPCSGNGSCGKCRVRVTSGTVDAPPSRHIEDALEREGWVLACGATVTGDVSVTVPDIASAYRSRLAITDMSSPEEQRIFAELQVSAKNAGFELRNAYSSVRVTLDVPTLDDTMPDNERLARGIAAATGVEHVVVSPYLLAKLPIVLRDADFSVRAFLKTDDSGVTVLDIAAGSDDTPMCGMAIDIGTTTVSALLCDLETGRVIARGGTGNGQIRYGADVINRIVEQQKPRGIKRLQDAIVEETLKPLISQLCEGANIPTASVYAAIVASNTTMNHLLLGIAAQYLRTEPYVPAFFRTEPVPLGKYHLGLNATAAAEIAPNIGSYVGGDITAGTLASMIWNADELSLFVDLGTNGEIVFGNRDFLMACACSAGPAFEGGDIKCGMRATGGAIEACEIDDATLEPTYHVFGDAKPVGICGSGLIDIIAQLFKTGAISGKGKFVRESPRIVREEYGARYILAFSHETETGREVFIDETDIDNFIRTKGAIFSAIMSLTESLGFSPLDAEHMIIAGGIGSGINIDNAITIGMFPALPRERYRYIGNSSLSGAYLALCSGGAAAKLDELSRSMTYVELSAHPGYMDQFVAACFLPHTDARLFDVN